MRNKLSIVAVVLLCSTFVGCRFNSIPPGSVGVKFNGATGVSTNILRPEMVWTGWNEQLLVYPTNIQQASFVQNAGEGEKHTDDSIHASTREGAILPVDVTVSYRIQGDAESIKTVFDNFGIPDDDPDHPLLSIQRRHIRWATVVAVNEVSGKHSIFDLISKQRAQFGPEVKKLMTPILEGWGMKLEDVMIREIHPPAQVTEKVNEQQQLRSELERIRIQKQQAITEAKTTIIEAQKEAEKNRLLSSQGDEAIALKKLEKKRLFYEKWNGRPSLIDEDTIPKP
jgi:regulator of protease activity HflC (stomatin/prohibitin superfamily)